MRTKKPYHKRRPGKRQIRLLCGEPGPGDGCDPRDDAPAFDVGAHVGRKAMQLCQQVQEALSDAFATVCNDPLLRGLTVVSVEPAPNMGRLLVTLRLEPEDDGLDGGEVVAHLQRAAGMLRCEVAAAISRRKVPELAFRVVSGPQGPELPGPPTL
jgi:ribosome-binding factor A